MMYALLILDDETEIVHPEMQPDARVSQLFLLKKAPPRRFFQRSGAFSSRLVISGSTPRSSSPYRRDPCRDRNSCAGSRRKDRRNAAN